MAVFNDTFTEVTDPVTLASHTPNTGTSWTVLIDVGGGSTLQVDSFTDTCYRDIGFLDDGVLYTADATYLSADYETQVTCIDADQSDNQCILAVRIQDANNMYAVRFNNVGSQL